MSPFKMRLTDVGFLLLIVLPFLVALDDSTIWDANEAFYVETPREMIERGDWIVPYFNGEPRLNKPPLSYWVVAVFYQVMGVSVLAERIATALVAATAVAFVFLIGRNLYSLPVALLGTGIFATTFRFLILSRRLIIDILLLCCLLGAFLAFLYWVKTERPQWLRWCALALGLGFLAKGPVTVLAPIAIGIYLTREGLWRAFFNSAWKSAALIFLAVSSFWFVLLLYHEGWEPVLQFFWRENVGRYTGVDFGPQRGLFYYPGVFLGDFFPWSILFLLVAARQLYASRRKGRVSSSTALLWIWMLVFFIFFSLSQNKQEYYILPVYPAAALWLAARMEEEKIALRITFFPALLMALAGGILWFISRGLFPDQGWLWIPLLFLAAAAILLLQGRYRAMAAGMSLFYTTGFLLYLSPLEEYKPVKPLAQAIQSEMARTDSKLAWTVGYYRFTAPSLRFYLSQDIVQLFEPEELQEVWTREGPVLLLVERSDYETLQEHLQDAPLAIVECKRKLYTTTRSFLRGFYTRGVDDFRSEWTREIYLVANYRSAQNNTGRFSGCPGL